jgi:hypothetical protein
LIFPFVAYRMRYYVTISKLQVVDEQGRCKHGRTLTPLLLRKETAS